MNSSSSVRTVGGALLIAGCCIGAGMLGMPILTALGGFKPSIVLFTLSWAFMCFTALLLLEVNLWFSEEVSIISMAEKTLGNVGKAIGWGTFLFLFYSLMVAYISGTGQLLADFSNQNLSINIPTWLGSFVLLVIFAWLLFAGTYLVDHFNRYLMVGLILSYLLLVTLGGMHVNPELLRHQNWKIAPFAIPIMIISFGFHNLIPSLTTYMDKDAGKMQKIIILGSLIPLIVYILWEWVILGLVPIGENETFQSVLDSGQMATHALQQAVGNSKIVDIAHIFAFFAIVTSCLGVALSFVDFLADGIGVKKTVRGKLLLISLVLLPPWIFAFLFPNIFLIALNYAGGFGAVILFGLLPAAMVWSGRYVTQQTKANSPFKAPGGKGALLLVILGSLSIMTLQIIREFQS